jgi:hypothetical protein
MRFRATLLVVGLCALVTLGLSGCSDDETPVTPVDSGIDNTSYPVVKAEFGNTLDSTVSVIDKGIELASDVNTGGLGNLDDILFGPMLVDSLVSQNTWHVLYGTTIAAGVSKTVIDSVQYAHDGVPQVDPQNANEITLHHSLLINNESQTGTYRDVESHTTLVITGLDGDVAVINGTQNTAVTAQIVVGNTTTTRDWVVTSEIADVNVSRSSGWANGCPTSGSITTGVELTQIINDGTPAATSWLFDVVFEDGTASVTVTLGEQSATYTKTVCEM